MTTVINEYRIYCETEAAYQFQLVKEGDPAPTTCPNGAGHTVGNIVISSKYGSDIQKDSELAMVSRLKKASWSLNYLKRAITVKTSTLNSLIDKDFEGNDYGHCSLKFYKDDGGGGLAEITGGDLNQGFLDANCIRTIVEINLDYVAELDSAEMYVPSTLAGTETDWKFAFVLAPTTVAKMGLTGQIRPQFHKGDKIMLGSGVEVMKIEPNKLGGVDLPGGHILHLIFDHSVGAKSEFYFEMTHYK
jgi:hypothetical protein